MLLTPAKLTAAAEEIRVTNKPIETSPRELLRWFGVSRRGHKVVGLIRRSMDSVGLETFPDFEELYVDAPTFLKFKEQPKETRNVSSQQQPTQKSSSLVEPSHRISRLKAAVSKPLSVSPNASIQMAATMMLSKDFSQLPVMQGDRDVKGIVSWRSIGKAWVRGVVCKEVRECMEPHEELKHDASIFDAIHLIAAKDCVLIRGANNQISGIVTSADISEQFQILAEPFLLLEEIEKRLRDLLQKALTLEEVRSIFTDQERGNIEDVSDLSLGDYQRLLEREPLWGKTGLKIDRVTFISELDRVRNIRNDLMHFDPDGLDDEATPTLRRFVKFLHDVLGE